MAGASTPCPVCGSTSSKAYLEDVADLFHGVSGTWDLQECTNCSLIYTDPLIPENRIGDYYPPDYAPYGATGAVSDSPTIRLLKWVAILPYTLRFGQPGYFPWPWGNGRLLEVGCGAGRYIQQMLPAGWECTGLDISTLAVETARKRNPSANFVVGALSDIETSEKFDLIVMHHVLEHLYHPRQAMATCFGLLNPGGKMVVNVPNISSWEAKWFGRNWKGLDMPRHIFHFQESVLDRLLVDSGFAIEKKRPGMFASSISESVIMCLPDELRRRIIHTKLERILYLMLVPVAAISYFFGNRGTVEIVAVKY